MNILKSLLFSVVIFCVLCISATAFAEMEVLTWEKSGEYKTVIKDQNVLEEDCYTITYQGLGKQPRGTIIYVFFKDSPSFTKGENAFDANEWRAAIDYYKKALESDGEKKKWVKSYAMFRIAVCYWNQNNIKSAVTWFEKLLTEVPETCFLGEISCNLGTIYSAQKKFDKAKKVLEKVIDDRKIQDCWREKAQVTLGNVYLAMEDFRKAKTHLESIVKRLTYIPLIEEAKFALGNCLQTEADKTGDTSKYKDAIKVYESVIKEYNRDTLCRAWTFAAYCYFTLKDYETAYKYGLRAGLLFADEEPGEAAKGLYIAGKAFLALYKTAAPDSEERKFYGSNIKLIRRMFETKLAGTSYASRGLDELK